MRPSCHICGQQIADDRDLREVVIRNGMIVRACFRCWFLWPDAHKLEAVR